MKKKTTEEMVAKFVAVDGFPPSNVSKGEFICQAFRDKGMLLPKDPNHVVQIVAQIVNKMKLQKMLL